MFWSLSRSYCSWQIPNLTVAPSAAALLACILTFALLDSAQISWLLFTDFGRWSILGQNPKRKFQTKKSWTWFVELRLLKPHIILSWTFQCLFTQNQDCGLCPPSLPLKPHQEEISSGPVCTGGTIPATNNSFSGHMGMSVLFRDRLENMWTCPLILIWLWPSSSF